ncbi:prepilin-type N-terminal cleavage/methylation domain-containing protein [Opitutaceae bacterium TAV1]|nr:prepilin-type N-terminal cleavage/methylation domain-containing protein [Opitutaceae bacterium TAV1]
MYPLSMTPPPPPFALPLRPAARRGEAFTLIELLTVIAIIGILAAIIIPTVGRVRESARTAVCLSNVRQIAVAGQMYAADNRDVLVPILERQEGGRRPTWRLLLAPYIGAGQNHKLPKADVFLCPASAATIPPYTGDNEAGGYPSSYGINKTSRLHRYKTELTSETDEAKLTTRIHSILNPSRLIMVGDIGKVTSGTINKTSSAGWVDQQVSTATMINSLGYARFPDDANFTGGDAWNIFPRHGRKANVAFYDGRAASVDIDKDILAKTSGTPGCLYMNE